MLDTRYYDKPKHPTTKLRAGPPQRFALWGLFWPMAEALCYGALFLSLLVLAVAVLGISFQLIP